MHKLLKSHILPATPYLSADKPARQVVVSTLITKFYYIIRVKTKLQNLKMIKDDYLIFELYLPNHLPIMTMLKQFLNYTILALLLASCDTKNNTVKENNVNEINTPIKQNTPVKVTKNVFKKKESDSIDTKNVVEFLTKYGKLNKETIVLIKTRLGEIKIRLYKDTPLHRANFIFLSKIGYFDSTCFYRVVPDFIIQGGNSERITTMRYRNKYRNYKMPSEFKSNRKHKYGAIAMARDWENNPHKKSNPFEFYIIQSRDGGHHLDGEHTVFGEVISGFSTMDKIVNLKTGSDEWPLDDVFMKVEVLD